MNETPLLFRTMICRRASMGEDAQPCEEAMRRPMVRVDRRMVDDPMKSPYIGAAYWYAEGRNHRVENGTIARDFDDNPWTIRFDDIWAFDTFVKKYGGRVVLSLCRDRLEPCYELEIYDDYPK